MIHPKDILLYKPTGDRYEVVRVGSYDLQVRAIHHGEPYRYPEIDSKTLNLVHREEWELVACSHTVIETTSDDYGVATIERLAYNAGTMEFELFHAWKMLRSALNGADADGDLRLKNIVGSIIESIERCGDRLKPKCMTDGTIEEAYLKTSIYANRK